MALPEAFQRLLQDPAPGLLFAAHKDIGVSERIYLTPHTAAGPPSMYERAVLRRLLGKRWGGWGSRGKSEGTSNLDDLAEFYATHNGARLFTLWDRLNAREVGAIELLPIALWDEATRPYIDGDMAWAMEGCEIFTRGVWRVIGESPSEGLRFVIFFDGEGTYNAETGDEVTGPLAGRMFAIALDPILGYEDLLAPNFSAFLAAIAADPAAFFERVGFGWYVDSPSGGTYGDPVAAYLPDARTHPNLTEWGR